MANNSAEWRQARQWLISSGVIPVVHPVTKPDVDLVDFARSLRDGVFLCNLLLKLKPGCIDNFNPRPIAQHSFLKNISSFLVACKTHFNITTRQLFEDSDLYEVTNFGKVVSLLSVLSRTPESTRLGWEPFPKDIHHDYYQDLDLITGGIEPGAEVPAANNDSESIYANLNELALQRDVDVTIYDHTPTAEEDPYADSGIYEAVVHKNKQQQKSTTDVEEKKKFILHELYETESNYVTVLKLIGNSFYNAMKSQCSNEDISLLFAIPQVLSKCHDVLLKGFKQCCDFGQCDIANCFFNEQDALLQYGEYAAQLPKATERCKQLQAARNECARAMQTCQERSQQRFALSELLSVPLQRVLKYPLLVSELIKCAKKAGRQNEVAELTSLHNFLNDISKYINETKRDFEAVKTIEDIELCLVEYKGPPLNQCGRLRFDGELRIKLAEERGDLKKRWAFLFDKVLVVCKRGNIIRTTFGEVKYVVKYVLNVEGMSVGVDSQRQTSIRRVGIPHFKLTAAEYNTGSSVKEFHLNGKSAEHKESWIGACKVAIDICCPKYARQGGHYFDLITCKPATTCTACDRLLWGMYHQGYYCRDCNRHSHTDCLEKQEECSKLSPRAMTISPGASQTAHPHIGRTRSSSNPPQPLPLLLNTRKSNGDISISRKGKIYVAKMRYDGNPLKVRRGHYLSFDKDEKLEILDQSDNEWWEAISLTSGNRGKVPAAYLKLDEYENFTKRFDTTDAGKDKLHPQNSNPNLSPRSPQLQRLPTIDSLDGHSWFVHRLSRIEAENMLKDLQDGVFLIRESDQRRGEYAIGLRWRHHPKHIKISVNPHTNRYFVSDAKDFDSVSDLVQYYQEHSLGFSFPGVDTTLRYPYWDVHQRQQQPPPPPTPQKPQPAPRPPIPPIPPGRPPIPPTHNTVVYCEAMYNFQAEYQEELSLEKHCHVRLVRKDTSRQQWWLGEYKGQTGLFPSNYVRELPPSGH